MSIRGSVDSLDSDGAMGWVFDDSLGEPLTVQAVINGKIIGEALAEMPRADLAAAGLGDGRCGFHISFVDPLHADFLPFVSIKPQGGDVELPRTNLTGFSDYFRSVSSHFPHAGRHRSVFGGLWTDRTNAVQLLQGRVAAGATAADTTATLRALISSGFAVMNSALTPIAFGSAETALIDSLEADSPLDPHAEPDARKLLEAMPGVIFRDVVLRTLRAILDDNPLAYRVMLSRGMSKSFQQPSAAQALSSPAECIAVIANAGPEAISLDVVRDSHKLPEFTPDGRSRWLAGSAAGTALAAQQALSVEQVKIGPFDLALIGSGTLYRLHVPEGLTAVTTWCAPAHVSPTSFIGAEGGAFTVRHFSGATLRT